KLDRSPALMLFGAGRERRLYAVPPYTPVKSLDFEDYPFEIEHWSQACALCGATDSYLDEVITDDAGSRMLVCSDTDYCKKSAQVRAQGRER
ncbi:alpha-D-ribose 1-methylphosphonate 5-phosphate C-P-lyase PhnJ, partial [Arthrospira platensis SPKY1]|nr:alpha-D-ribose 1-methylphosphonate 5-phosphate C-P-lyase PhnJ [Arthrospira platensis SPKY1]